MAVRYHVWRIFYVSVCVVAMFVMVPYLFIAVGSPFEMDRKSLLSDIYRLVEASRSRNQDQVCHQPRLSLFDSDIMRHIKNVPNIECGVESDWVQIVGSTARITDEARSRHGEIECIFEDIVRQDDFTTSFGEAVNSRTYYHLEKSDFIRVSCIARQSKMRWQNILAGVRLDQKILKRSSWDRLAPDAIRLNVLMFGFDSLSRNMFIRKLPKTYRYLHEMLQGITLEGYNIVGDGTPQALIPILTGKTELELPETRKRMGSKASYVNIYPFIWNDYRDNGYVTAFLEDCHDTGIFTYRLKGFKEQPTDHYMRPYYLTASKYYSSNKKYCMGSTPRHKVMMNYAKDFFRVYRDKPKFLFGFHGELSHDDINLIGAADDDMVEWLKSLQTEGHLNNTLLIIMSDHGHRFAEIRNTLQGKQEERLPFFSFVFPPSVKQAFRRTLMNFITNTRRLTTPFDIHATLGALLHFPHSDRGSVTNRSIALFQEVPQDRTCADAFIEPHWCTCLVWQEINLQDTLVIRAADALVQHINRYTKDYRSLCAKLHVSKIHWAGQLLPTQGLLHYYKNKDMDGFIGDMSDHTVVSQKMIQVKVTVQPGNGLFEASVMYNVNSDDFNVKISDISRINQYGSDAQCVYEKYEHLRKYCYCQNTGK